MLNNVVQTPLMRQYYKIKTQHPDAILLFRVGDFYETFEEDAVKTSQILGITLTKRANGTASYVDLAGFPYHAIDTYLPKLIRAGQRVAICDQLEDPKLTKTVVRRGITEIVTPGVTLNDNVLEQKKNNYVASVAFAKNIAGVAFLDVSTGDFFATEGTFTYISSLIGNFKPAEVIYESTKKEILQKIVDANQYSYPAQDWMFNFDSANERLLKQFETVTLKGFGLDNLQLAVIAAGAVLSYLDQTQHSNLKHIITLHKIDYANYLVLDKFTVRNLEILYPLHSEGKSLVDIIDKTKTAMGSRLLRRWLAFPLTDSNQINFRLNTVEFFTKNTLLKNSLYESVSKIQDLERLSSKIASSRINPREIIALKNALKHIHEIQELLDTSELSQELNLIKTKIIKLPELYNYIDDHLNEDPPNVVGNGNVIRQGIDEKLDELRNIANNGMDFLSQLRDKLAKITQIPSLKISYNKVFGYYIEVTNTHKNRVPADWIRKQTLVNAERYITIELKEYEEKILSASERIENIEKRLYDDTVMYLQNFIEQIKINATTIAELDCLISFANLASEHNYNKPVVDQSTDIDIKNGRHPVIETQLPLGEPYIPNDVFLDEKKDQILIITGPNMAGKSALLRQVALISIMAQIGSFVPADAARIGYLDRIFTRVGASDNISLGESTFMVEMTEAAYILNNLTHRSLVVFDELGRGTSTYDGISIAWSIVEFLHQQTEKFPKTLFATHYHELNEMEKIFERIKNYNVSVKEENNQVIFLRKLARGGSEHSFGIHVAKMAGIPRSIVKRAEEVLKQLEHENKNNEVSKPTSTQLKETEGYQLNIFQLDDPVLKNIRDILLNIDINSLTPLEALNNLDKIKRILKK